MLRPERWCYSPPGDRGPLAAYSRAVVGRPLVRCQRVAEGLSLSRDLRINQMIRVPTVRVVDEEGSQLGVMPTFEALRLAQERGYDLVEVAPMAAPPVARLLDYGQFKYEAAKKEKEARKHQRSVDFKEIRLKPKIGSGDFETKVRRAIQFLEDGDRVKVACQFRGRELTHAHLGRDLLLRFAEQIKDYGTMERQPLLEGKSMSIVIASTHRPKAQVAAPGEPKGGPVAAAVRPSAPAGSPEPPGTIEPAGTSEPTGAEEPATAAVQPGTTGSAAEEEPVAPGTTETAKKAEAVQPSPGKAPVEPAAKAAGTSARKAAAPRTAGARTAGAKPASEPGRETDTSTTPPARAGE